VSATGGASSGNSAGNSSNKKSSSNNNNKNNITTTTGSHLLPPTPLYAKGDVIQVLYDGKWWEATITKRKKKDDEFYYSAYYHHDEAKQDDIPEDDIRPGEDPGTLAVSLGFTSDWKASRNGSRYILTAPTGETFTSKKAAMKFFRELQGKVSASAAEEDAGDPPWRLEGHELIGRKILWSFEHRASATRRIKIEQIGTVAGYIDAKDKDKNGDPGFVSEATGQPANLFHVTFEDDPNHPYAPHLLSAQDFEGYEIQDLLIPSDGEDTGGVESGNHKKKKRRRS